MKKENILSTRSYKERYDLIRHEERIRSSDVIEGIFTTLSYFESPDPTLIAARGKINGIECIILGQEKRRKGKESSATGMVLAKGYAFVLEILNIAEEEQKPIISFIDTFGGDSSMDSEMGGQSFLISDCISRYCYVAAPTLSYIIGEGGSGGALALQVADKSFMLENALYSVIAPESCSRIIFHKRLSAGEDIEETLGDALEVLRPGADHLMQIGMVDGILPEPKEGAHTDYPFTISTIKKSILDNLEDWMVKKKGGGYEVKPKLVKKLLKERRKKVLNFGRFKDTMSRLAKRKTKRSIPENINRVSIERDDFHTIFLMRAHMEKEGLDENQELYNCELEWDKNANKFRVAGGCGFVSFKDYVDNFYACPKCGKGEYLCVDEQIEKICDKETFRELEGKLTMEMLLSKNRYYFGKYKASLEKLKGKTFSNEGLVTGTAKINGKDVVLAITDLKFFGGSFGAVFGEKFKRAVDYSVKKHYPFISVCASGGARMNEGPMSLAQMAKMNMSLLDLKNEGILYISVIPGPTTGGAYASYVTQGDIIIGEKGALAEFAGPRVVMGAGIDVDRTIVTTDKLYETGKIHHVVHRRELKETLSYYVEFYHDVKFPKNRKIKGRIKDFSLNS